MSEHTHKKARLRRRDWLLGMSAMAGMASLLKPGLSYALPSLLDDNLRTLTVPFVKDQGFNGVVLVGRGGALISSQAFGVADAGLGGAMQADTRFELGSISKWLASVLVMKLVDLGRLTLDAPLLSYLPDYRADTGAQLQLRHLLSHCSGVPNQIAAARKADPALQFIELDQMEAVRRYASGDLVFKPRTAWDYSHANWLIVKAVVERVTGQGYAELVREHLTAPLGLKDSGIFHGDSALTAAMAKGYAALKPQPQRRVVGMPGYMAMAGGFYATAADLFALMNGVLRGAVLSPAARKDLMTVVMPDQHYALGGRTRTELIAGQLREAAWQDGSNGGFRVLARQVLADGHSVIIMNNSSFDYQKLGGMGDLLLQASYGQV